MELIAKPNFSPSADCQVQTKILTAATINTTKANLISVKVQKGLCYRRIWALIGETVAGSALDVAGSIALYSAGTQVTKIPWIEAGGITAFGWNPTNGAFSEAVSFRQASGNVFSGSPFTIRTVCDEVRIELDSFSYAGGTALAVALMVVSEYWVGQ